MGDGYHVVAAERMEVSSLPEGRRSKNLEIRYEKDNERGEGHSGEPDELDGRIAMANGSTKAAKEIRTFPYSDTKLRPEAPPFTPECVSPRMKVTPSLEDTARSSIFGNTCFVNVELTNSTPNTEANVPDPRKHKSSGDGAELEDAKSSDPGTTAVVEKSQTTREEEHPVAQIVPSTSATSGEQVTPRGSTLSRSNLINRRTRIIALVASLIICVIVLVFVLI